MADIQSLQDSMDQYEEQLSQVKLALSATTKGPDRDNLLSLQSDIQELIALTTESLKSAKEGNGGEKSPDNVMDESADPMAREYALFKSIQFLLEVCFAMRINKSQGQSLKMAGIDFREESFSHGQLYVACSKAELEQASEDSKDAELEEGAEASNDIEDELKALEGMKCRAPHGSSWGGTGYHNAMVSSIHRNENEKITSINDIKVRVLFVNPTHREMLPCPYYLDGACKFSDEQCHYSHGEIVPLSNLQEYREPVFSSLRMGSRVMAKQKNNLWHRCVILKMPENEDDDYRVKFESSGNIAEIPVQDLLPLEDADLEMSDSSDESESDRDEAPEENLDEALVQRSLLTLNTREPLGNWEQHTRGIGSKLMAQMGYVHGTGLGKRADGRVAPVEATVLPAGKSLDHCMELREHAGGDKDFFSVERKLRKQRLKMEQQREKQYLRDKARRESDVFNFINTTLGNKPSNDEPSSSKSKSHYKAHTNHSLNVANFQVSENITRLERESSRLMNSLGRHSKGSLPYNNIAMQYNEKQSELADLRSTRNHIATEQNQRKDKAKLSVF